MRATLAGFLVLSVLALAAPSAAQPLPVKWEELTSADFVKALEASHATCTLPFGVIEKHGPSAPLGTDLINVRHVTAQAAKQEYTIVFPEYYFGQIAEARHQAGTLAYSTRLQMELLQETVAEMARNGCAKVIIVNGHGGNNGLLEYFAQTQLDSPRDYVVYTVSGMGSDQPPEEAKPSRPGVDGHAGEEEVASIMASRPELAHPERGGAESGADQDRLSLPEGVYTPIWWYARFPNHYGGDASGATAARGQALTKAEVGQLAKAIAAIKADETAPRLQKEFFERSVRPGR
ncbi:MAG: creatininase family protein [Acidobacteria bacterium]|nr:creatininase family protein [Acidobacteriota bacterium]